jgi:hypothetical protein
MQSIVKYFLANILFLVGHCLADVLIFGGGVVLDESTLACRKKWYTSDSGQCPVKK